jgi:hypothetical protein
LLSAVVKQFCTVLHKKAIINNLGGRLAKQLQYEQEYTADEEDLQTEVLV